MFYAVEAKRFKIMVRFLRNHWYASLTYASQSTVGNVAFRTLIGDTLEAYRTTKKAKGAISQAIVDTVHSFGGRFLKKDRDGRWTELTVDQQLPKVGHAFRDAAKLLDNQRDYATQSDGTIQCKDECAHILEDCRQRVRYIMDREQEVNRRNAITAMSDTVLAVAQMPSEAWPKKTPSSMDRCTEPFEAFPTKALFSVDQSATLLESGSSFSLQLDTSSSAQNLPCANNKSSNSRAESRNMLSSPVQMLDSCSTTIPKDNGRSSFNDSGATTMSVILRQSIETCASGVTVVSGIFRKSIDTANSLEPTMECDSSLPIHADFEFKEQDTLREFDEDRVEEFSIAWSDMKLTESRELDERDEEMVDFMPSNTLT